MHRDFPDVGEMLYNGDAHNCDACGGDIVLVSLDECTYCGEGGRR